MTESSLSISVLLVCRDSAETSLITEVMRKFGISVRHSVETEALELVKYQKFEAAVVDFNVPLASMILDQLHGSASNKTAVTFAILNGKSGRASSLKVRASIVLHRPLSPSLMYRTLQAAYGMILHERRRYFRCPIVVPVTLQKGAESEKTSAHSVYHASVCGAQPPESRTAIAIPLEKMRVLLHEADRAAKALLFSKEETLLLIAQALSKQVESFCQAIPQLKTWKK